MVSLIFPFGCFCFGFVCLFVFLFWFFTFLNNKRRGNIRDRKRAEGEYESNRTEKRGNWTTQIGSKAHQVTKRLEQRWPFVNGSGSRKAGNWSPVRLRCWWIPFWNEAERRKLMWSNRRWAWATLMAPLASAWSCDANRTGGTCWRRWRWRSSGHGRWLRSKLFLCAKE